MSDIKVSLFASSVRPALWLDLFNSLNETTIIYEIVFAGPLPPGIDCYGQKYGTFQKIITKNIKPAQCYEIARRACTGETVVWIADDCEFKGDIIGKAYAYWKSKNDRKLILSLQTAESGYFSDTPEMYNMDEHRFYGGEAGGPLMAPICMMDRQFLEELGGLDRRYICGQYENDIVMRAYQHGASVEIFGDKDTYVEIDHLKKSIDTKESNNKEDFLNRPFAKGYNLDRKVLEGSWTSFDPVHAFKLLDSGARVTTHQSIRKIHNVQLDAHEPYAKDISYTKSESNNLPDMWD